MEPDFNELGRIVKKIKAEDGAAFEKLYELTYQRLYLLSYSILKDEEDAKDAVQESYIKIYANIHSLHNDKLFLAWANKIVYSICIRMCEKKQHVVVVVEDGTLQKVIDPSEERNPAHAALKMEKEKILAELIGKLTPALQTTLLFRYYENLKIHQIAEIMDCPKGTVKSRLNTAKRQLKVLIDKEGRGDILFVAAMGLVLKKAFTYYAKGMGMDPQAAFQVLIQACSENGISTSARFHPRPPGSAASGNLAAPVAAMAGGSVGLAVLGITVFSAPVVENITIKNPPEHYTNQSVEIAATISAPLHMLSDVYVKDGSGKMVSVTLSGEDQADFTVNQNGNYTVYVVSKNNKMAEKEIRVDCIDKAAPGLSSYEYTKTEVILKVEDALSGVDYQKVYGETEDGERIEPVSCDNKTGTVVFPFPQKPFRLFLTDMAGNVSTFKVKIVKK